MPRQYNAGECTSPGWDNQDLAMPDELTLGEFSRQILPRLSSDKTFPKWPPDCFALCLSVLKRTGAYVPLLSDWPPRPRRADALGVWVSAMAHLPACIEGTVLLARLNRIDALVIDDWAMAPLSETERRDFWEICEDRYQARSLILTSQLPVTRWHEQIGDPTVADGILDRLVHNAHRIEMRGDSKRKSRGKQPNP